MSKNSNSIYLNDGCFLPEYEGYCKKCKKKTKFFFSEYVEKKYVSYSCSECNYKVKTLLKIGKYMRT